MEHLRGHDRYLELPDEPESGECDGCGYEFNYDDMRKRGRLCDDCLKADDAARAEQEAAEKEADNG